MKETDKEAQRIFSEFVAVLAISFIFSFIGGLALILHVTAEKPNHAAIQYEPGAY